jgi:peptidyl-prolyl isomerase D
VSGTCVAPEQRAAAERERSAKLDAEKKRLSKLKNDKRLPLVWFDIEIKKKRVGRIEMVLFTDVSPRSAENFRQLVTGEAGVVPKGKEGEGKPLHFRGAKFYRIIHKFIDQAGIDVPSVYGGEFKDDAGGLKLKHVHKGLLSMANMGPNTNTAHFSIMMGPSPHLDGHYTIFGQVVQGFDVIDAINNLSIGKPDNTATAEEEVVIVNCGQDRQGTITADLNAP